jgi:hypothetical protein
LAAAAAVAGELGPFSPPRNKLQQAMLLLLLLELKVHQG